MRKLLKGVVFLCLLLSACTPLQTTVEELMEPPKLTDRQYQVNEALRDGIGQSFKLKYPQSGEHRSAFTFCDLDEDGNDEAVVFYTNQNTSSFLRLTILYQEDGQWRSGPDLLGLGVEVDFIRVERLSSHGVSLVVGWIQESSSGRKIVAIYHYNDGNLKMDFAGDYSRLAVDDFDGNGTSEMLLITAPSAYGNSSATLVGETASGLIDILDDVALPPMINTYLEPITGIVKDDGAKGVVVDGYTESRVLTTTVIRVEPGGVLSLPLSENDYLLHTRSTRHSPVFSQDINNDGIIEIPLQHPIPGYDFLDEATHHYITNYSQLSGTGFSTVARAFVNSEENYMLFFPPSWMEAPITLARQPELGETIFFLYDGSNIYQRSQELCRIRVYSSKDYQDKLAAQTYFPLGQKGAFQYFGSLPTSRIEGLSIHTNHLREMFRFIN